VVVKVTVGLASYSPFFTDFSGLTPDGLNDAYTPMHPLTSAPLPKGFDVPTCKIGLFCHRGTIFARKVFHSYIGE